MNKKYYDFDTMSTTQVDRDVLNTYQDLLNKYYANSDSLHTLGQEVAHLLKSARQQVAKTFHVFETEIIFTSGASEANNLAIKGYALKNRAKGNHLITTAIEHASVFKAFQQLETEFGFDVTYLQVDEFGNINFEEFIKALKDETILVSMMAINNEVGTILPIPQVTAYLKKYYPQVVFHSDFVQALGKYPIDLNEIDLAVFSAHKVHGLKGSGILVKKNRVELLPLISGGIQEFEVRGGTVANLTQIMWAKTLRLAFDKQTHNLIQVTKLNQYLRKALKSIPELTVNSGSEASVYIVNVSINVLNSEIILNGLNQKGILISAASTCSGKNYQDSHVLKALGFSETKRRQTFRIGLDESLTERDLDYLVESIKEIIKLYGNV